MQKFLINVEGPILLWIQENVRNDFLTPIMKFITQLGDMGFIWIAITLFCLVFAKTRKVGILAGISLLINVILNNLVLKNIFARTRPYEVVEGLERIIEAQSDFSFPSGHTGCSFAAAVVIFLMCPRKTGVPALILASLIAFSRMYVGVHFPTDILGGIIVSAIPAILVCRVHERRKKAEKN